MLGFTTEILEYCCGIHLKISLEGSMEVFVEPRRAFCNLGLVLGFSFTRGFVGSILSFVCLSKWELLTRGLYHAAEKVCIWKKT